MSGVKLSVIVESVVRMSAVVLNVAAPRRKRKKRMKGTLSGNDNDAVKNLTKLFFSFVTTPSK